MMPGIAPKYAFAASATDDEIEPFRAFIESPASAAVTEPIRRAGTP